MSAIDFILDQYDEKAKLYADFLSRQVTLLTEFLKEQGPRVYAITGRVKERDSLRRKLMEAEEPYQVLEEVPDLAGIRVVTYFEEQVAQVAEVIQREFKITRAHIVDQGVHMDPERFGYPSRSYVVGFLDNRLKLIEYRNFKNCRAEIQVRSLFQHAWAEIEKELGYRGRTDFPKERRRQFSRIAHLLEVGDEQLNEIRTYLRPYEKEAGRNLATPGRGTGRGNAESSRSEAAPAPDAVIIRAETPTPPAPAPAPAPPPAAAAPPPRGILDLAELGVEPLMPESASPPRVKNADATPRDPVAPSISAEEMEAFILSNDQVRALDKTLASHYDTKLMYSEKAVRNLSRTLEHFNLLTIPAVDAALTQNKHAVLSISRCIFGSPDENRYEFLLKGISLFLLGYVLIARSGNVSEVFDFMKEYAFEPEKASIKLAKEIVAWQKEMTKRENARLGAPE
ncbi:MAG: RelA/SpoT domain-containing protein [Magnetococcus sp. WYHC-3]